MKSVTLDLPDNIAFIFEALPKERKLKAALLAAFFAQAKPKSMEEVLTSIDKRVAASGIAEKEIDQLLDELS
jgi:preprotein translocase subunit SecD